MFIVYFLKSLQTNRLYIGYTSNLESRLKYHNSDRSRSTKNGRPWEIVYTEKFTSKTEALQRERFLKNQKNREFYNRLILGA